MRRVRAADDRPAPGDLLRRPEQGQATLRFFAEEAKNLVRNPRPSEAPSRASPADSSAVREPFRRRGDAGDSPGRQGEWNDAQYGALCRALLAVLRFCRIVAGSPFRPISTCGGGSRSRSRRSSGLYIWLGEDVARAAGGSFWGLPGRITRLHGGDRHRNRSSAVGFFAGGPDLSWRRRRTSIRCWYVGRDRFEHGCAADGGGLWRGSSAGAAIRRRVRRGWGRGTAGLLERCTGGWGWRRLA